MRIKGTKPSELPESGVSFLYCRKCRGEFSARRGDYFWAPGKPMKCCGINLVHVKRENRIVEVMR